MRHSVALTSETFQALSRHLLRIDGQEDLCFAVWYPSTGKSRTTALIGAPNLPQEGEREVHGNASFTSDYFIRASLEARAAGGGVALLHSHPGARGWQPMSQPDRSTESRFAPRAAAVTGLPFVGVTIAGDGALSARFWERVAPRTYEPSGCTNVRVVGQRLACTWDDALARPQGSTRRQVRTVSAWGDEVQRNWTRLRIGIVGAGSVGALVAEALARAGATQLLLLDFDTVEEENLDRLLHATERDASLGRAKVHVLARGLRRGATASEPEIAPCERSVVEPEGLSVALDCDILFSCVDRPWPRAALNYLSFAHLIPVIDVGIRVTKTRRGNMRTADWRSHVAAPSRACLACVGQYDPGQVTYERDGSLDDPRYIDQLPVDSPLRSRENVFGFSLGAASLALSQFVSLVVAPGGVSDVGTQRYRSKTGDLENEWNSCNPVCPYLNSLGLGDSAQDKFRPTGDHPVAQRAREARAAVSTWVRVARSLDDLLWRAL
jgi:hypothetical protein